MGTDLRMACMHCMRCLDDSAGCKNCLVVSSCSWTSLAVSAGVVRLAYNFSCHLDCVDEFFGWLKTCLRAFQNLLVIGKNTGNSEKHRTESISRSILTARTRICTSDMC